MCNRGLQLVLSEENVLVPGDLEAFDDIAARDLLPRCRLRPSPFDPVVGIEIDQDEADGFRVGPRPKGDRTGHSGLSGIVAAVTSTDDDFMCWDIVPFPVPKTLRGRRPTRLGWASQLNTARSSHLTRRGGGRPGRRWPSPYPRRTHDVRAWRSEVQCAAASMVASCSKKKARGKRGPE